MKKFYGVMTDIYDDDTWAVFPLYGQHERKPPDTLEQYPGVRTYKDWFETEKMAKLFMKLKTENLKKIFMEMEAV